MYSFFSFLIFAAFYQNNYILQLLRNPCGSVKKQNGTLLMRFEPIFFLTIKACFTGTNALPLRLQKLTSKQTCMTWNNFCLNYSTHAWRSYHCSNCDFLQRQGANQINKMDCLTWLKPSNCFVIISIVVSEIHDFCRGINVKWTHSHTLKWKGL